MAAAATQRCFQTTRIEQEGVSIYAQHRSLKSPQLGQTGMLVFVIGRQGTKASNTLCPICVYSPPKSGAPLTGRIARSHEAYRIRATRRASSVRGPWPARRGAPASSAMSSCRMSWRCVTRVLTRRWWQIGRRRASANINRYARGGSYDRCRALDQSDRSLATFNHGRNRLLFLRSGP